jgi:hypothetical protein
MTVAHAQSLGRGFAAGRPAGGVPQSDFSRAEVWA